MAIWPGNIRRYEPFSEKELNSLWETMGKHLKHVIEEQNGIVVVITGVDTPEGGMETRFYTFVGYHFMGLRQFVDERMVQAAAQAAEEALLKALYPDGSKIH